MFSVYSFNINSIIVYPLLCRLPYSSKIMSWRSSYVIIYHGLCRHSSIFLKIFQVVRGPSFNKYFIKYFNFHHSRRQYNWITLAKSHQKETKLPQTQKSTNTFTKRHYQGCVRLYGTSLQLLQKFYRGNFSWIGKSHARNTFQTLGWEKKNSCQL